MYFGEVCFKFVTTFVMQKKGPKFNIAISFPTFILQIFFLIGFISPSLKNLKNASN